MPRTSGTPNALSNGARGWWVIQLWSRCRPVLPSQHAQHLGTRTSLRSSCSRSLTTATRVVTSAKLTGLATNMALPCAGLDAVNALQISASSTAPGGVPNQWSVATPQAASGWARPPCRLFKIQSCERLGCAFEAAAFQTKHQAHGGTELRASALCGWSVRLPRWTPPSCAARSP